MVNIFEAIGKGVDSKVTLRIPYFTHETSQVNGENDMFMENILLIDVIIERLLSEINKSIFEMGQIRFAEDLDKIKLLSEARKAYIESESKQ